MSGPGPGRLVLVATPIGNLGDLSPRAVEALRGADVVACEDTRRTGRLLEHAGIEGARLVAVHDHNEREMAPVLVDRLRGGEIVAFATDAGTPAVSDPGYRVVAAALEAGVEVTTVPGPSAAVAALAISGLPTDRWVFEGFLPRKGTARTARLAGLVGERRTIVVYEAPQRVGTTLADLAGALGGDRAVAVARELTKLHEEVWRGTLADAVRRTAAAVPIGEHVLVVAGAPDPDPPSDDALDAALAEALAGGVSVRDAADAVARSLGVSRKRSYTRALEVRDRAGGGR